MKIEAANGKVSLDISGTYTTQELDKLVQQIAEARAQIAKDPDSPVGMATKATSLTHWHTEFNAFVGGHQLSFRTLLGWQTFLMSPSDGARLIHFLAGQLAMKLAADEAAASAPATAHNDGGNGAGTPPVH